MSKGIALAVAATLSIASFATAQDDKLGGTLVSKFFTAAVKHDKAAFDSLLAPGFQSAHEDGGRTKAQEMKLLLALNIKSFKVTKLKVTRQGENLIATYFIQAAETIDNERLNAVKPAPRLSVFRISNGKWQLIAHANLRAL